jgi:3-dehydroquinate synthase
MWSVNLVQTQRRSSIRGGPDAASVLGERAARVAAAGRRLFVITDRNVMGLWGAEVIGTLGEAAGTSGVKVVPPGENSKSVATAESCWQWLASVGARRDDAIVALGGGVIGDLAGFVAATYLRGLELWQVPTTLLAQVDSSVGGKVGINLAQGKNLVGSFYQADLVVIDPSFLSTLAQNEFAGGLGEVVKYALLADDDLLEYLEGNPESIGGRSEEVFSTLVRRCVQLKADVVIADETEHGPRAVLNLGHTTAHALENALGYGEIGHGVAVGLGLLVALAVGEVKCGTPRELRPRVVRLMDRLGLPTRLPLPPAEKLLEAARRDKKISSRGSGFVLLEKRGRPVFDVDVTPLEFAEALDVIRE